MIEVETENQLEKVLQDWNPGPLRDQRGADDDDNDAGVDGYGLPCAGHRLQLDVTSCCERRPAGPRHGWMASAQLEPMGPSGQHLENFTLG